MHSFFNLVASGMHKSSFRLVPVWFLVIVEFCFRGKVAKGIIYITENVTLKTPIDTLS